MPDEAGREALRTMRLQVDAAHATAERLVREAETAAREQVRDVPPQGWAAESEPEAPGSTVEALKAIAGLLEVVRGAVPPELAHQFAGAVRELLVAVRALIDFYLDRLDQPLDREARPAEVEDIPID
ncbi:MAG: hypothetical protein H0V26_05920 [Solirubrobacterales bacterium]|nr:hypothetical protein [Solirubrobacterales bacterium]